MNPAPIELEVVSFMRLTGIQWDQRIPMRDGVEISADIYYPRGEGKFPAIIIRTPYGKTDNNNVKIGRYFSGNDYVTVICDVRGRGDSDGEFTPYFNEGKDGYDVIEWAARQEWCDGHVGTMGGSYLARIQWTTALEKPPHLKAMISTVVPSDPFVESPTGVPDPIHISWSFLVSGRALQNVEPVNWEEIYSHLPLVTMDEETGRKIKGWKEAFNHTTFDDYWKQISYQSRFNEIDLPVMHISGWYDDEQIGTPMNYHGMRKSAGTPEARERQKLVMGPWPHGVNKSTSLGEIDFGPDALVDLLGVEKRWFDRWLKFDDNGMDGENRVSIFVMGENRWREEKDWPLPDTEFTPFYFSSGGKANSRFGDGVLSTDRPGSDSASDRYIYDPEHPYPFITEQTSAQIGGTDNYSAVEIRDDVLIYTSVKLDERLEATGPVKARLFVSTDVQDTDFNVKLLDVWPSGYAQRLCDGVIRGRYREGMTKEIPMVPGQVYELEVDMWNTSQVFLPGHRIRVEVASSAFPKYSRNQNVWEKLGMTANVRKASQTLYHDSKHASCVILPVIPKR